MKFKFYTGMVLVVALSTSVAAQDNDIDCEDEANEEAEACLALPPGGDPITNFVPIAAGIGGVGFLGFLGGGSTTATTSTTSTTN